MGWFIFAVILVREINEAKVRRFSDLEFAFLGVLFAFLAKFDGLGEMTVGFTRN